MIVPYITISYDSCWKDIVVGYGKYKLGTGIVFWRRLFGLL